MKIMDAEVEAQILPMSISKTLVSSTKVVHLTKLEVILTDFHVPTKLSVNLVMKKNVGLKKTTQFTIFLTTTI